LGFRPWLNFIFIAYLKDLPKNIRKVFVAGDANVLKEDRNEDILITK
jgi:hypothetical protein